MPTGVPSFVPFHWAGGKQGITLPGNQGITSVPITQWAPPGCPDRSQMSEVAPACVQYIAETATGRTEACAKSWDRDYTKEKVARVGALRWVCRLKKLLRWSQASAEWAPVDSLCVRPCAPLCVRADSGPLSCNKRIKPNSQGGLKTQWQRWSDGILARRSECAGCNQYRIQVVQWRKRKSPRSVEGTRWFQSEIMAGV